MDTGPPSSSGSGGGGGGGPAPFLLKTYDMVDDSSTDEIVSWSSSKNSFVVWNPPEFARLLLPTYFKHSNFSSFIRQLNTYGFRKIDPEKWEFANEGFAKDQKHLLKNIHRRKPIHSHSHPHGSLVDPERAAFDDEIDRLAREKDALESSIMGTKHRRSTEKLQLEDLTQRVNSMEQRQEKLMSLLEKAVQNPTFIEHLSQRIESMDFSAYNKKRRLPQADHSKSNAENSFVDSQSSSRLEFGNVIHQDFSNKPRLELSPAVSDINLVSNSTQSSNEDRGSPKRKASEGDPEDPPPRTPCLLFATETFELADTGTSCAYKVDPTFSRKLSTSEPTGLQLMQPDLISNEEADGHISCHLNLTLASCPLQVNRSPCSTTARLPELHQELRKSPEPMFNDISKNSNLMVISKERNGDDGDAALSSSKEGRTNNQGPVAAPVPARVNDVFWEQFLTERPGSCDNEEASSNYRANRYDDQEDRRPSHLLRNAKNVEHLSL